MQQKLAAIGSRDQVLAFRALGIEAVPVSTPVEAARELNRLAEAHFAVIFIAETLAVEMEDAIARYKSSVYPAIIPVPTAAGSMGLGMKTVRANVEKAIGADILFREEVR